MSFDMVETPQRTFEDVVQPAVIKVVGVGGAGGKALEYMVAKGVKGVQFLAVNTDVQALSDIDVPDKLQIGPQLTRGLGAGADPSVGRDAAKESADDIRDRLSDANMVFITAGMGGGTGTGAAPIVAELARQLDEERGDSHTSMLVVGVVTTPFEYENRTDKAEVGVFELNHHVDCLLTIPNEKLFAVIGGDAKKWEAFAACNDILLGAVRGISDILVRPGDTNVDFADVHAVMQQGGLSLMGTGQASGDNRVAEAIDQAVNSPLLDDLNVRNARGIVLNVITSQPFALTMNEDAVVADTIRELQAEGCTVVAGSATDSELDEEEVRIIVVVTGLGEYAPPRIAAPGLGPRRATMRAQRAPVGAGGGTGARDAMAGPAVPPRYLDVGDFVKNRMPASGPRTVPQIPDTEGGKDQRFDDIQFLRRQAD